MPKYVLYTGKKKKSNFNRFQIELFLLSNNPNLSPPNIGPYMGPSNLSFIRVYAQDVLSSFYDTYIYIYIYIYIIYIYICNIYIYIYIYIYTSRQSSKNMWFLNWWNTPFPMVILQRLFFIFWRWSMLLCLIAQAHSTNDLKLVSKLCLDNKFHWKNI